MKQVLKERFFFLSSALSLAVIAGLYPDFVFNPGSFLLDDQGDALKNYYVYLYHILHDPEALQFSGMNYPYGEFLLYTDSQPLLSSLLRIVGADISFALACMHLCIFLSLASIGPLFYMILRRLEASPFPAFLIAVLAVMLNPQAIRIGGHFALAWSVFIPLAWYFSISFVLRPRFMIAALLSGTLVSAFFIHPYLGVLASGLSFFWGLLKLLPSRHFRSFLALSSAILFPLLFFQSLGWIFDNHENRTSWPYGFYEYHADAFGVLLPHHGPIGKLVTDNKLNLRWEGWAYAGLAISVLFVILLFRFVGKIIGQRRSLVLTDRDRLLIMASIFLIVATALPFMGPLDRLYEWLPPLRQFRAIGRFSWIWWYAMLALAGLVLSQCWNSAPKLRPWFVTLFLFSALEGYWQHRELSTKVGKPVCFEQPAFSHSDKLRFQAILPLPYFHMGSDNSTIDGKEEMVRKVFMESIVSGLPFFGADESRISWKEARESIRLFSTVPGDQKPVLSLFDSRLLKVLAIPELMSKRDSQFYSAYVMPVDKAMVCSPDSLRNSLPHFLFAENDSVPFWPEFRSDCGSASVIIENFEPGSSQYAFTGAGSFEGIKRDHKELLFIPPGKLQPGIVYELSYWVWSAEEDQVNEMMIVEEYDPQSGWKVWKDVGSVNRSADFFGDWTLGKLEFTVERDNSHIKIMSKGSKGNRNPCWIDQLIIREKGCDIWFRDISGNTVYLNNLPLRLYSRQQ